MRKVADAEPVECTGVELVSWPDERDLRARLARAGVPRMLLVSPGAAPPESIGPDEDWIRMPADERDVVTRMRTLLRNVAHLDGQRPWIDEHRIARRGETAVVLTAAEAVVATALFAAPGTVVSRTQLESLLWQDEPPSNRAVEAVVYRLRRRLLPLHVSVRTVRGNGRGFGGFAVDA